MKLYKHVHRHRVLKAIPKRVQAHIRWAMSLSPGDLINNCSGFNVEIKTITPIIWNLTRGWIFYDVEFETSPGGFCSLRSCGVSPPRSVAEIEQYMHRFYDSWTTGNGWNYKTDKDPVWVSLSSGKPICDELGRSICLNKL